MRFAFPARPGLLSPPGPAPEPAAEFPAAQDAHPLQRVGAGTDHRHRYRFSSPGLHGEGSGAPCCQDTKNLVASRSQMHQQEGFYTMAITLCILLPRSPSNYSTSVSLQHGDIRNLAHFALFLLPATIQAKGGLDMQKLLFASLFSRRKQVMEHLQNYKHVLFDRVYSHMLFPSCF